MRIANCVQNEPKGTWKERLFRYTIGILIFLGIYLILLLLYIYPHLPIDLCGWTILISVGIPLALSLELIGEFVLRTKTGRKISSARFSAKRISIVIVTLLIIAVALGVFWYRWAPAIRPHFK